MSVYESLSETQQFACRVIADHARATAFAIADGIYPGPKERNSVLRKIMRRAIYHGREHLGLQEPFFYKVCDFVVSEMSGAYPEIETQREVVKKIVTIEETRFAHTMTEGLKRLEELLEKNGNRYPQYPGLRFPTWVSDGQLAHLKDTYGLPVDLMYVALVSTDLKAIKKHPRVWSHGWQIWVSKNHSKGVDLFLEEIKGLPPEALESIVGGDMSPTEIEEMREDGFHSLIEESVRKLQEGTGIGKTERKSQISPIYADVLNRVGPTRFVGYDATRFEGAKVTAIIRGDVDLLTLNEGEEGGIVLDTTPFYAESGGQVGDTGVLLTDQGTILRVLDTFAPLQNLIVHKVRVEKGAIRPSGDDYLDVRRPEGVERLSADTQVVTADVDVQKRDATRRNHTATHLVHAALREVLGTHVKQGGSVVAPNVLRFDFTHYQPMTDAEIAEVEDLVNREILKNEPVNTNVMAIEEAMAGGAMALFGEKYGADVRVLSVGDGVFSKELCGGTHVRATGDIGSFKITADEAIASGVRRIRAITGFDAFERFREDERLIDRSLGALKTQRDNLPSAIEKLQEELKRTRKENDELKLKIATGTIGEASSNGDEARDVNGVMVLGKIVEGLDANGTRQLSDTLLSRMKSGVVVLGRKDDGKVSIIVRVSDDLTGKIKAGNVIKEIIPIVGGRGGGKPDMAEGGGSEPDKLSEAIDASYKVIETFLTG
jgi:alanyl-tRNA synthetase